MRSSRSPKNRQAYLNQVVSLDQDYAYDISKAGTSITISSSDWSTNTNVVSLASAATSGDTTSVKATASNSGTAMIENKVTLSNGLILQRYYRLKVLDPMQEDSQKDYP